MPVNGFLNIECDSVEKTFDTTVPRVRLAGVRTAVGVVRRERHTARADGPTHGTRECVCRSRTRPLSALRVGGTTRHRPESRAAARRAALARRGCSPHQPRRLPDSNAGRCWYLLEHLSNI